MKKEIVHYDPDRQDQQVHFRGGTAVFTSPDLSVGIDADREIKHPVSPLLYWALFNLGVVDALNTLPLAPGFPIEDFEEGILLPEGLSYAAKILRTTAETLKSRYPDGVTTGVQNKVEIEYHIKIDVIVLKQELYALADFMEAAEKEVRAVQLWL